MFEYTNFLEYIKRYIKNSQSPAPSGAILLYIEHLILEKKLDLYLKIYTYFM